MSRKPDKRKLKLQLSRQVKQKRVENEGERTEIHTYNERGHFVKVVDEHSEWDFPALDQLQQPPESNEEAIKEEGEEGGEGDMESGGRAEKTQASPPIPIILISNLVTASDSTRH